MATTFFSGAARLSLALSLSACSYDLDPLFDHGVGDGGAGGDAGLGLSSQALIGAWIGHDPLVDQDCVSCAEQKCGDAETACRGDAECVAYTQCVGANPNPAGIYACRALHTDWVRADVRNHDISGPYGQCVFKYSCSVECGGNEDLSCLTKFSWPATPAASVPLHLYLADAIMPTASVPNHQGQSLRADGPGVRDADLRRHDRQHRHGRAFAAHDVQRRSPASRHLGRVALPDLAQVQLEHRARDHLPAEHREQGSVHAVHQRDRTQDRRQARHVAAAHARLRWHRTEGRELHVRPSGYAVEDLVHRRPAQARRERRPTS